MHFKLQILIQKSNNGRARVQTIPTANRKTVNNNRNMTFVADTPCCSRRSPMTTHACSRVHERRWPKQHKHANKNLSFILQVGISHWPLPTPWVVTHRCALQHMSLFCFFPGHEHRFSVRCLWQAALTDGSTLFFHLRFCNLCQLSEKAQQGQEENGRLVMGWGGGRGAGQLGRFQDTEVCMTWENLARSTITHPIQQSVW